MSEMIKAYQEINKRRQSDGMDVNSLTMFAEAWGLKQVEVDILQTKIGILQIKLNGADGRAAAVLNHKNKMIDELQAKIEEINEVANGWKDEYRIMSLRYERSKKRIDELQARVDEALRHVVDHGGYDDLTHVINILKGNKDEK